MAEAITAISPKGLAGRIGPLLVPAAAAAMLLVVLIPVPPAMMDLLLATNIALAAVVFLTTIFVSSPLEFSVFPSLLLGTTLLRLVLNIATTRLILTAGDGRSYEAAHLAAGHVIWSFSEFVAAGSLAVGAILFCIIAVIQFVVITKGAARISEVAARFVLDAMPGKQMAIDADLNASLIDEAQARQRREDITRQADFYGAMDGASKFLRGDAVAAVIITLVNILGGFYVGLVQYGWSLDQTIGLFTRLTIGDGLTTQIPAVLISVSAALLVTRTTVKTNLAQQLVGQLVARPAALAVTAFLLAALMLTSLPTLPLGVLAMVVGGAGWIGWRRRRSCETPESGADNDKTKANPDQPTIDQTVAIHPLQVDLGFALIALTEPQGEANLLEQITAMRRRLANRLGLLVPPVRLRDDVQLGATRYRVSIRGAVVASGRLYPEKRLACGSSEIIARLNGPVGVAVDGHSHAVWIDPADRPSAEAIGADMYHPAAVLVAHLQSTVRRHAPQLLTRQTVVEMLNTLKASAASVVDEARRCSSLGTIQRVLQGLLGEGVPIRDLETILETLCETADRNRSVETLIEQVRLAQSRVICQQCADGPIMHALTLAEGLEATLAGQDDHQPADGSLFGTTERREAIVKALEDGLDLFYESGYVPVVLCRADHRRAIRHALSHRPETLVLSWEEVRRGGLDQLQQVTIDEEELQPAMEM